MNVEATPPQKMPPYSPKMVHITLQTLFSIKLNGLFVLA